MSEQVPVRYFLGANTGRGFFSVYDDFTDENLADHVWYIKGGPGNGKSTFMRRVAQAAEEAGQTVEYALCSGDPDSLDGIYIREKRTAYVDATSPHVQEPGLPGAVGKYIDLSTYYIKNARFDRDAIREGFARYREAYGRAYHLLRAASLTAGSVAAPSEEAVLDSVQDMALELVSALPEQPGTGRQRRVFLSACTCRGLLFFPEMLRETGKIRLVHSSAGLEDGFLRRIAAWARERGTSAVLCPDPLDPEKLEGVLLPDAGISFFRHRPGAGLSGGAVEHIRLDRCVPEALLAEYASDLRSTASIRSRLVRRAVAALESAKSCHDALEELYRPTVDFSAVERFTCRHIRENIG